MGTVKGCYNVGIVMSRDTDLKPAMEAMLGQLHGFWVEVAAWTTPGVHTGRLGLKGRKLWCHWLTEGDYSKLRGDHDYNRGAR